MLITTARIITHRKPRGSFVSPIVSLNRLLVQPLGAVAPGQVTLAPPVAIAPRPLAIIMVQRVARNGACPPLETISPLIIPITRPQIRVARIPTITGIP